jgi:hypothetical protein
MTVDPTVTLGNIIEMVSILGTGFYILLKQTFSVRFMQEQIKDIKQETSKITEIVTDNAVRDKEMMNMKEDIRDLKRGRGYIQAEISGEYTKSGKVKG